MTTMTMLLKRKLVFHLAIIAAITKSDRREMIEESQLIKTKRYGLSKQKVIKKDYPDIIIKGILEEMEEPLNKHTDWGIIHAGIISFTKGINLNGIYLFILYFTLAITELNCTQ